MQLIKSMKQGALYRVFENDRRYYLTVASFSFFAFDWKPGARLKPDQEMWALAQEELGQQPLDEANPKPRSELLVCGNAYAPTGTTVTTARIRVSLGEIVKKLHVNGDCHWRAGQTDITSAVPFAVMPLRYEHAFGGEGFASNPTGKGACEVEMDNGERIRPLPNIQDPRQLIASADDRPEPAGLMPCPIDWPQRMSKAGTYDEKWITERFPGFAADMDWTIFNMAPIDQQLAGRFRGDEPFSCNGMHPEMAEISGELPGVRARAFLRRKAEVKEPYEMDLHLDTVWLFPHRERGVLIHRGVLEIATDDAAEFDALLVAQEGLGDEPKSLAHYAGVIRRRCDPDGSPMEFLKERELMPVGERSYFADMMPEEGQQPSPSPFNDNLQAKIDEYHRQGQETIDAALAKKDETIAKTTEELHARGVNPKDYLPEPPDMDAPAPLPFEIPRIETIEDAENFDADDFTDNLEAYGEEQIAQAQVKADQAVAEQDAKMRAACEKAGLDYDEELAKIKQAQAQPPEPKADKMIEELRELQENHPEQMQEQYDALGMSLEEIEETLRESDKQGLDAYRQSAHTLEPPAPLPEAEALALRDRVWAGFQAGEGFAGARLMGANLSGLDLSGIDLSNAFLNGANLYQTNLTGANLAGCVLAFADLREATLRQVGAPEASFGKAVAEGADLAGSDLTKAIFSQGDFRGADLRNTVLDGAMIVEAVFAEADLSGASLQRCQTSSLDLRGAVLDRADLTETILSQATTDSARFAGATMRETLLIQCALTGADFTGIDGPECKFAECELADAVFREANLQDAVISNSTLDGADLSNAKARDCSIMNGSAVNAKFTAMDAQTLIFFSCMAAGADFSDASVTGSFLGGEDSSFAGANFANACLDQTYLGATDLTGANFENASLCEASLMGSDLRGANLRFAVAPKSLLLKTDLEGADMSGSNLAESLLRGSRLVEADLHGANLFGADLQKATFGKTNLDDALLTRTILKRWQPS